MEEKREILDPEQRAEMHDLVEAIVDLFDRNKVDTSVGMHALCRTIAYGGIQLDKLTKRQLVAMVVESVSAHYDSFQRMLKHREENK